MLYTVVKRSIWIPRDELENPKGDFNGRSVG